MSFLNVLSDSVGIYQCTTCDPVSVSVVSMIHVSKPRQFICIVTTAKLCAVFSNFTYWHMITAAANREGSNHQEGRFST